MTTLIGVNVYEYLGGATMGITSFCRMGNAEHNSNEYYHQLVFRRRGKEQTKNSRIICLDLLCLCAVVFRCTVLVIYRNLHFYKTCRLIVKDLRLKMKKRKVKISYKESFDRQYTEEELKEKTQKELAEVCVGKFGYSVGVTYES